MYGCKWGRPHRTGYTLPSTGSKSHLVSVYHFLFTQPRKAKTTIEPFVATGSNFS
jgi:hypothetical protein